MAPNRLCFPCRALELTKQAGISARYTSEMSSLYIDHFGLRKPPFQITPDLDFFFAGGRRGDILTALLHVAAHDEGIITLVAEVGSGKTLLARLMIKRLAAQICTVYLANPCFSRDEIIAAIARDLGLTDLPFNLEGKLAALQQELLRRHALGQRVLLVIDEAHAMPVESLEEVRLLSNLETGQHKLINIMLFGQPELDALLAEPRLRQVRDRVIHRFELQALQSSETSAYVDHRLRAAGWQGAGLFSTSAMDRLIKASQGRARRINLLADKALLAAYAQGSMTVEVDHVKSAVHELPPGAMHHSGQPLRRRWWMISLGLGGALLVAIAMTTGWGWRFSEAPRAASAQPEPPAVNAAPPEVAAAAEPTKPQGPVEPLVPAGPVQQAIALPPAGALIAPPPADPEMDASSLSVRTQLVFERTQARLKESPLIGYTVQLGAFESPAGLDRYLADVEKWLDPAHLYAQSSDYKGKTYMAVCFGNFASAADSTRAIETWPSLLRGNRPLVRSWVKVKQEQTP